MTDELRALFDFRRALQALAALTGEDAFCDIAAGFDGIAELLWRIR